VSGSSLAGSRVISAFRLAELRTHPERLFLPFASFWLLVNVSPLGFGPSYLVAFYQAFTFQKSDQIFPVTYAVAVVLFFVTWSILHRFGRLVLWRGFLIAGTSVFAGPGAFEVIYQEAGAMTHPVAFQGYALPYVMFSYLAWVVLGLTGAPWWKATRRVGLLVLGTVAGWGVWFALGFPLVIYGTVSEFPVAYALNIVLKVAMFLVFILPIWEGAMGWDSEKGHRGSALPPANFAVVESGSVIAP
jgi:hypothetical protein